MGLRAFPFRRCDCASQPGSRCDRRLCGPAKTLARFFLCDDDRCAGLLWFSYPDPSFVIYTLVVFSIANISFEVSQVFYNAMLPTIVLNDKIGQLSGWGWGLGYIGGLACLVLLLTVFVQAKPPPLGLDTGQSEHVRIWTGRRALVCIILFAAVRICHGCSSRGKAVGGP